MLQIFDRGHLAEFENRKKSFINFFRQFQICAIATTSFFTIKVGQKNLWEKLKNQSCNINKIYDFFLSLAKTCHKPFACWFQPVLHFFRTLKKKLFFCLDRAKSFTNLPNYFFNGAGQI